MDDQSWSLSTLVILFWNEVLGQETRPLQQGYLLPALPIILSDVFQSPISIGSDTVAALWDTRFLRWEQSLALWAGFWHSRPSSNRRVEIREKKNAKEK